MGIFWELLQQGQLEENRERADSLEDRVERLEDELVRTRILLYALLQRLETHFGEDIDGDGRVG
jgi:hypothetical protein